MQTPSPVVVATVTHRAREKGGSRSATVGVIQKRRPKNVKRNGGRPWAAWAHMTLNGLVIGPPERFETFTTEERAREHAERAAGKRS